MRYWFLSQASCVFDFRLTENCHLKKICIGGVSVLERLFGGAGPSIFYMIHRGGFGRLRGSERQLCVSSALSSALSQCVFVALFSHAPVHRGIGKLVIIRVSKKKIPLADSNYIASEEFWPKFNSRHVGSLTAANWVSFDFNVAYSSR